MELHYTHIYETARSSLKIGRDDYALCNYIFVWASYPGSARRGWCDRTLEQKARFIGITPRGITKMQNRLLQIDLIEKDPLTGNIRTTLKWFDAVMLAKSREQSSFDIGTKFPVEGEQSSLEVGTKFPVEGEQSSFEIGNFVPIHNKELLFNPLLSDNEIKVVSPVDVVVDFLNATIRPERPFRSTTKKTIEAVNARLKEKYTVDDICLVIEFKTAEWLGDSKMEQYLRPSTLFGTGNFEAYLVNASNWNKRGKPQIKKNGQHSSQATGTFVSGAFGKD